jgi:hypothetical protein
MNTPSTEKKQSFRGRNTIRLNGITMVEVVQQFLDREMTNPPTVESVTYETQNGATFVVHVEGK